LNVEDSEHLAQHDVVIFADASVNGAEPFFFESLVPDPSTGFSSHSVEPQALLALAWQLFGATTRGWVLGIRGYEFNEFCEELSDPARRNLQMAVEFVRKIMQDRELFKKESNLN
jgi:Ni,Fe-hydrogenase maturation factor